MSKITFLNDDPTYGKQVSGKTTPQAILVPQGKYTHLLHGITLVPATDGDGDMHQPMPEHYEAERIEIEGTPDYGTLVSAVVRSRYSADEVEAIVLNGSDTPEHEAEYEALQQWRSHAKEIAKQVLTDPHPNPLP